MKIEISENTFIKLQKMAKPLIDDNNSVINRLIDYYYSTHNKQIAKIKIQQKSKVRKRKKSSEWDKIKVVFPDGTEILMSNVGETMVEVIRKIGFDKVKSLDIQMYGYPIVSDKRYEPERYKGWVDAGRGVFIFTHSNTDKKFGQLNEINDALGLGLLITKV